MADAVAAGDKNHGDGCDASHEEGVVVSTADHLFIGNAGFGADLFEQLNNVRGRLRGGVGVDEVFGDGDAATVAEIVAVAPDGMHDGLAAIRSGVANVEL